MQQNTAIQISGTIGYNSVANNKTEIVIHYYDNDGQEQEAQLKYSQYPLAQKLLEEGLLEQRMHISTKKIAKEDRQFTLPIYAEIKMVGNTPVARIHKKQFYSTQLN